jgi:gamma-glutamylcyclotransferase (GGCT)/AIG2-like uncharacterized protein YtfP
VPSDVDALFAYGSLAFDEVLVVLLGRVPERRPSSLPGWRAARLSRRPYPGLVAHPTGAATGVVLTTLTATEWRTLDDYEGPSYARRAVGEIDGGTVFSYVWLEDDVVEQQDWDRAAFAQGLPRYLELVRAGLL